MRGCTWHTLLAAPVAVVGLVLGQADAARAASFSVNPIQITLSASAKSALLTVKNETDLPVRFQVTLFAWSQDPSGQMVLAATQDVAFFPALLTLKPHEERKVRVGATVPPAAVEKTYRIFIEELPPLEKPEAPSGVTMLTRMGIPIFLQPAKVSSQAALRDLAVKGGHFGFRLLNTGTVHFIPQAVLVRGVDAAGAVVIDQKANGWYVLAGGVRVFDLGLDEKACSQVRSLTAEVTLGGTTLKESLQTPGGACAR
jgi:fimbrial chaperone protein